MARKLWKKKLPKREDKPFKERNKIAQRVFDNKTIEQLHEFFNSGLIEGLDFPIAQGKEAMVFRARGERSKFIAVKIYKYETSSFHTMFKYVQGDPRFQAKKGLRQLVELWARKEFSNLKLAQKVGVAVPKPIKQRRNVVIMQFIGNNGTPSRLIKDSVIDEPEKMMETIVDYMHRLYHRAKIVHADLNEFNIILHEGQPILIDFGQAVSIEHPDAMKYLESDCYNVAKFFNKLGVPLTKQEVLERVLSKEIK